MVKKRKHSIPKNGPVFYMTSEEATLSQMPHYNGYACGYGRHGDDKYNRSREKRKWQKEKGCELS